MTIHERPPSAAAYLPPIDHDTRRAIEDHVAACIAYLDAIDGDLDLEPDLAGSPNVGAPCDAEGDASDDEPSLGSLGGTWPWAHAVRGTTSQVRWAAGGRTDAEFDDSDLEDGHDREASDLAGVGFGGNLEADDCDLERTGDDEPSLGWTVADADTPLIARRVQRPRRAGARGLRPSTSRSRQGARRDGGGVP